MNLFEIKIKLVETAMRNAGAVLQGNQLVLGLWQIPVGSDLPTSLGLTSGTMRWTREDRLDRVNGPAMISKERIIWSVNGSYHRDGKPAYIEKNRIIYFVNGRTHRIDGPAVIKVMDGIVITGYYKWNARIEEKQNEMSLKEFKELVSQYW